MLYGLPQMIDNKSRVLLCSLIVDNFAVPFVSHYDNLVLTSSVYMDSVLFKNHFSGAIPKELADLTKMEQLDLRDNNLSGTIPAEIGRMRSLKRL